MDVNTMVSHSVHSMYVAKCLLFLCDLDWTSIWLALCVKFTEKTFQWEPKFINGDRQTDVTKLIVKFRRYCTKAHVGKI